MEEFRQKILDVYLSSKIKNFSEAYNEGLNKKNSCAYFDGRFCKRITIKEEVLAIWRSEDKISPHPILCYLCPYFSLRDEGIHSNIDLFEILSYYEKIRSNIIKEIEYLEARLNEFLHTSPSLRRRREELILVLQDIEEKRNVALTLIKSIFREESNGDFQQPASI
ncbi:MAG: hypothetical protein K1T65_03560 [Candidatus Aramenus sp.]|nr:hypothetical protein [Candidatus Aramenus sp.]